MIQTLIFINVIAGRWSQSSSEKFNFSITGKHLMVHLKSISALLAKDITVQSIWQGISIAIGSIDLKSCYNILSTHYLGAYETEQVQVVMGRFLVCKTPTSTHDYMMSKLWKNRYHDQAKKTRVRNCTSKGQRQFLFVGGEDFFLGDLGHVTLFLNEYLKKQS